MKTLIAVFFADTTTNLDLVVLPPAAPTSTTTLPFLKLRIDDAGGTRALVAPKHCDLHFTTPNSLSLPPGVYFFATDNQIKYSISSGDCRVALQSGKDPWPPPPPPAPQGTDLKMWEEVYKAGFSGIVTTVGAATIRPWIVVSLEDKQAA